MDHPPLTLLIDGKCPLCAREAAFLTRRDRGRNRLRMVDITDPDFDPADYGTTMDELMGQIHAVAPDGSMLTGMEVFRRAYQAIGLGWLIAPTGWPVLKPIADRLYRWFAKVRPRLQGKDARACADGRCKVDYSDSSSATR